MKVVLLRAAVALLLTGTISLRAGLLTVGANLNITAATNNQAETTIAVNPLNPQNLFFGANGGYTYTPARLPLPSVFYYSMNVGANLKPSDVSALPAVCYDQSTSWDDF